MFKVAAMLGYAERHGHIPVFVKEPLPSKDHEKSAFRLRELFPSIPILEKMEGEWIYLRENPDNCFTYTPLPKISENVMLEGYFQSEEYIPSKGIQIPLSPSFIKAGYLFAEDWKTICFLHIRRGDYLHPFNQHHRVNLESYIRTCLKRLPSSATKCFVASDDIEWCQRELPSLFPEWKNWLWCPADISDRETFFWMTMCGAGAICANSTFSWWAAYFIHQFDTSVSCFMPVPWGFPPLPETRNLYPKWAISTITQS